MNVYIDVPDGVSGDWRVETFTVPKEDFSQMISAMKYGRSVPAGIYKRLMRKNTIVMSNTPDEISDFIPFYNYAHGTVLINGLGLGTTVKMLLEKDGKRKIDHITVIENSEDVIKLVAPSYQDPRVTIIHADAFTWIPPKGQRWNCVWHDIWDFISADNIDEMKKLHRKYGKRCDYQESWCRYRCELARKEEKKFSMFW